MSRFPWVEVLEKEPVRLSVGDVEIVAEPVYETVWRFGFYRHGEELGTKLLILDVRGKIKTLPAHLDLPVLLKFTTSVEIGPKALELLFLSLPIQVEVLIEQGEAEIPVETILPVELKRAWYGEPQAGDLSYYFVTEVFYSLDNSRENYYEALLPVRVRNLDQVPRRLEKLMIDSYQLSLYERGDTLLAEVAEVVFLNGEAEIDYTDEAPYPDCVEIRKGEESAKKKGLAKLTRRRLKWFRGELLGGD